MNLFIAFTFLILTILIIFALKFLKRVSMIAKAAFAVKKWLFFNPIIRTLIATYLVFFLSALFAL